MTLAMLLVSKALRKFCNFAMQNLLIFENLLNFVKCVSYDRNLCLQMGFSYFSEIQLINFKEVPLNAIPSIKVDQKVCCI